MSLAPPVSPGRCLAARRDPRVARLRRASPASGASPVSTPASHDRHFPEPDPCARGRFLSPRLPAPRGAPSEADADDQSSRRVGVGFLSSDGLVPGPGSGPPPGLPGIWRSEPWRCPGPAGTASPRLAGRDSTSLGCRPQPPLARWLSPPCSLRRGHSTVTETACNTPDSADSFSAGSPPALPRFVPTMGPRAHPSCTGSPPRRTFFRRF